ncbi:MAG: M28 family metallopeptidase [Aquificaceae bacterium]|nr:M28 family metallopeptidase [Aquificaceae bacterium]MDW8422772.1 M28 family metallopeptidase [Aquificaceae bacterium]
MKGERLELFKELAYKFLTYNRLTGTREHKIVHKLIESFLDYISCKYSKEDFWVKKYIPKEAYIHAGKEKIRAVSYLGSPSTDLEAYVKRDYVEGDIALLPEITKEKAFEARKKGAVAIITYREEDKVEGYTYGDFLGIDIPVLSVSRDSLQKLEDYKVRLLVNAVERSIRGTNIFMELGRGPIIYLVAHMDTVHGTYGAISNGVGFLLLLFLYEDLRKNYNAPYRLRFLITDGRELGLEGARFHSQRELKHVFYCINLEGIGWHNPCVIYEDMGGYNGERINHLFHKHVEDLKVKIDFYRVKERDGDHIPFKEKGIQTLFLSSHPLTIRHTAYDNYDAISWDHVVLWYEVIIAFLRRFHKL